MAGLAEDGSAGAMPPEVANGTLTSQRYCYRHHSVNREFCEHIRGYYAYHVDFTANTIFLTFFAASLVFYVCLLVAHRGRGLWFAIAMTLGLLCEVIGYSGRVLSSLNRWDQNGFLMQMSCLTIGPAFMAAALYLCLRRIVMVFGPENSRIRPEYYTRIFIPCDIISLILQASGGGGASTVTQGKSPSTGTNLIIAGLSFQVFTLLCFIFVSLDFAIRTYRRRKGCRVAFSIPAPAVKLRRTIRFRLFLGSLALSTLCILWRSSFRVAELGEGWSGPLMGKQGLFIGFEGVLVLVTAIVLSVFHPMLWAPELFQTCSSKPGSPDPVEA